MKERKVKLRLKQCFSYAEALYENIQEVSLYSCPGNPKNWPACWASQGKVERSMSFAGALLLSVLEPSMSFAGALQLVFVRNSAVGLRHILALQYWIFCSLWSLKFAKVERSMCSAGALH